MKNMVKLFVLAGLVLILGTTSAMADTTTIALKTTPISSSGPYTLVFAVTDGDGVADNSITLSNFHFGGGSSVGTPDYLGTTGVGGDLNTSITLDDSGFVAFFTQQFAPGSVLSFDFSYTNNFDSGAVTPDQFLFALYDAGLTTPYSDDPSGTGALLYANLTGATPLDVHTFGSTELGLSAPQVPEPASAMLLCMGFALVGTVRRRLGL